MFEEYYQDPITIGPNSIVRDTDDTEFSALQIFITNLVILSVMTCAIQFNDQFLFRTTKIRNVLTDWMLAAEFETGETLVSEEVPEFSLLGRHVLSEVPSFLDDG